MMHVLFNNMIVCQYKKGSRLYCNETTLILSRQCAPQCSQTMDPWIRHEPPNTLDLYPVGHQRASRELVAL